MLEGKFQGIISSAGDRIPRNFKDIDGYWYGVFYDPAVFLVNQQFARTVGQEKLTSKKPLAPITKDNPTIWSITSEFAPIKEGGLGVVPPAITKNAKEVGVNIPTFICLKKVLL